MKIVVISDTHGKYNRLTIPDCDILISCGDYSFLGEQHEVRNFHKWLNKQKAKHIISVQGNHEKGVEKNWELSRQLALEVCPGVHFIDEGLVEIEGLKIWCSAISPWFYDWAWNRKRGQEIRNHWDRIPKDVDILVTHGPPMGILDGIMRFNHQIDEYEVEHVGCWDLMASILSLKQLKYHFFGHIHEGYGVKTIGQVTYVNASNCNSAYQPTNRPVVIEMADPLDLLLLGQSTAKIEWGLY